ncbi:MAG: PAS domain S-box protein, partial [Anaerolineales bacterium]|nr:PAS domain S-box protein [Anaerolineales bacterium]
MNEPIKKLAVLIVEDSESDAQLIVLLFKKADYELVYEQVETAEQMRAALDQRAWDVVISDYRLPQFDGRAALKLLQDTGRDIPFIVVSGTIGEETAVAMMRAGVHDYLIKGNLTRLIPAVERELEQSAIRRARKQAEEALKESEEKYRELVQDLPDAIAIYIDGKIIFANNACVELMRAKNTAELLGRSVIEFVHPDSKEFVINRMLKVMKEGKPLPLAEEKFVRLDGTDVSVEVKALPITFEKKPAMQIIVRDITERKQAEEALRESEERYRSLFDRMLDGMYCSTHAGKFVDVNPAMVKMFGYSSREEMLEMDIKSELYFDSKERGTHIKDTGQGETDVYRLRRKDGSEIWVEDHGNYTHDEQGEIVFHEGIMRDVTARVQAEKTLAASEAELRTLVEQVPTTIYTESAENRETLYISPQVEKLTGYTPAEWIKDRYLWKQMIHPEDLAALLAEDERTTATHELFRAEYRILTRDGRTRWLHDEAVMVENQDGTPLFWQGVMYDITERVQAEKALAVSEAELRALFASMRDVVMVIDRDGVYREIAPT